MRRTQITTPRNVDSNGGDSSDIAKASGRGAENDSRDSTIRPASTSPVDALAYSADGSYILCISGKFINELDSDTLLPARAGAFTGFGGVRCMAVSRDGTHIALGYEDAAIAIVNGKTYAVIRQIEGHCEPVNAVSFSPNGSRLVSASDDWTICIWDVQSGERVGKPLEGRNGPVCAVTLSPNGKNIVSGSWDGTVIVCDAESGEAIGEPWDVRLPVLSLAFSPDGTRLITAVATKEVLRYFKSDEAVELPPSSEARCHCHGVYSDGCRMYTWTRQTSIQVWDAGILTHQKMTTAGHANGVFSVAFSPDGQQLVSGSADRSVRVWDTMTGEPVEMEEMQHSNWVCFVTFSPDGEFIASGGHDNNIRIWDAQTGYPMQHLEGHTNTARCAAYSPDGMRIVSGSDDRSLRLWNTSSGRLEGEPMTGHDGYVGSVAFSPDGTRIASASWDSTVRLWDGHTREALGVPLSGHDGHVYAIAFSPDGTRLASGGQDYTVRLWDVEKRCSVGEPLRGHTSAINSVTFSPDGNTLFSSSHDKTVRCWDASSGKPVGHPLIGHTDYVYGLAISRDGERIVSGSRDNTIRVWDTRAFQWEADRLLAGCGLRGTDKIPALIPDDGWIRTPDEGLLLWVPAEHRNAVCDMSEYCISHDEGDQAVRILWDKLCHGERWTDIWGAT